MKIMGWEKKGLIFKPRGEYSWSLSHAQVPFAYILDKETVRIFYSTRDEKGHSGVGFIDCEINDPKKIKYVSQVPSFQKGSLGAFDDAGTMPSWFVDFENKLYMYYTGWNKSESASYRLAIGLAVSNDQGRTFQRIFNGPIMDRGINDPVWVGQPCVIYEEGYWKMWYLSCQKIVSINDHPEPFYNVKYAESTDGINWERKNIICIDFDSFTDAIGRPCVYKEEGVYKMFYSFRNAKEYRVNPHASYRIGYAESQDGIVWTRVDGVGLDRNLGDWETIMQEYCTTYSFQGTRFLIYNGNGFGSSGFGFAILNA